MEKVGGKKMGNKRTRNPRMKAGVAEIPEPKVIAKYPEKENPEPTKKEEIPEPTKKEENPPDKRYGIRPKTVVAGLAYLLENVKKWKETPDICDLKERLQRALELAKKI